MARAARAWVVAALGLLVAAAGLRSLLVAGSVSSLTRSGIAAAVLSAYVAVLGIITTRRSDRTRLTCLLYGGVVPGVLAGATLAVVWSRAGVVPGTVAAVPWLTGPLLVWAVGRRLPALRWPRWRRRDQ